VRLGNYQTFCENSGVTLIKFRETPELFENIFLFKILLLWLHCLIINIKKMSNPSNPNNAIPISWDEAEEMIQAYRTKFPNTLLNEFNQRLDGFRIPVTEVVKIIQGIPLEPYSGPQETYSYCKDIFMMPAVRPSDTDPEVEVFTIVVAGIDADNKIMKGAVYEYMRACPPICPTNFI
jgi:hypothetical protein